MKVRETLTEGALNENTVRGVNIRDCRSVGPKFEPLLYRRDPLPAIPQPTLRRNR
jgi:hypothetical protein